MTEGMKDHIDADARDAQESDVQQKLIDARRDRAVTNREHQFAAFCESFDLSYIDQGTMDDRAILLKDRRATIYACQFIAWLAAWTLLVGGDLDARPED